MKFSAVAFLALLSSAAAFVPTTSRAVGRVAARAPVALQAPVRPATALRSADFEDDVEQNLTRVGLVGGIGFPILAAPFAGMNLRHPCASRQLIWLGHTDE